MRASARGYMSVICASVCEVGDREEEHIVCTYERQGEKEGDWEKRKRDDSRICGEIKPVIRGQQ